jgi:hypothetical protein
MKVIIRIVILNLPGSKLQLVEGGQYIGRRRRRSISLPKYP